MTNTEILNSMPEGSTQFADGVYLKETKIGYDYFHPEDGWMNLNNLTDFSDIRSLEDIRRIVYLEELVAACVGRG